MRQCTKLGPIDYHLLICDDILDRPLLKCFSAKFIGKLQDLRCVLESQLFAQLDSAEVLQIIQQIPVSGGQKFPGYAVDMVHLPGVDEAQHLDENVVLDVLDHHLVLLGLFHLRLKHSREYLTSLGEYTLVGHDAFVRKIEDYVAEIPIAHEILKLVELVETKAVVLVIVSCVISDDYRIIRRASSELAPDSQSVVVEKSVRWIREEVPLRKSVVRVHAGQSSFLHHYPVVVQDAASRGDRDLCAAEILDENHLVCPEEA